MLYVLNGTVVANFYTEWGQKALEYPVVNVTSAATELDLDELIWIDDEEFDDYGL